MQQHALREPPVVALLVRVALAQACCGLLPAVDVNGSTSAAAEARVEDD